MKVAIHQPHFFPWIGYFNKIANSDCFVFLNDVQMEKGSYMYRNRVLNSNGEISYITLPCSKHGILEKSFSEIIISDDTWKNKHLNLYKDSYGKSKYYDEIIDAIIPLYNNNFNTVCECDLFSIKIILSILGIETKIVLQSELNNSSYGKKNDLVLDICSGLQAETYLSGNGAKKYMDLESFKNRDISVEFQNFKIPKYRQMHANSFIEGLSMLDMLFCIGIENTRELFWSEI